MILQWLGLRKAFARILDIRHDCSMTVELYDMRLWFYEM